MTRIRPDPKGKQYVGSVDLGAPKPISRRAATRSPTSPCGAPDIDIPDRKFKMTIVVSRRNTDTSLPGEPPPAN